MQKVKIQNDNFGEIKQTEEPEGIELPANDHSNQSEDEIVETKANLIETKSDHKNKKISRSKKTIF